MPGELTMNTHEHPKHRAHISPSSPIHEQPTIGIIGMGAMGRMYANRLSKAGWGKIYVCDRPEKYEALQSAYSCIPGVTVFPDGHGVARSSDFIQFCVEAEFIDSVVATYGPSAKVGAIVSGQTSVKAPEIEAFEKHLPSDVYIVSIHSLHGPTVSPIGQPLVLIQHRAPDWALHLVEDVLSCFQSRYVHLSAAEHDLLTANTQAVTHAAFLSMGTAWCATKRYPWENGYYVGGIETAKVNITLRLFSNLWHIYAGLAILNPVARIQIDQYAKSTTEIYKLMLDGDEAGLRQRMQNARSAVFYSKSKRKRPILLSEAILDRFSLGKNLPIGPEPNSHLSLLAMVDCWAHLEIDPFSHLELAATPLFRIFLGVAEVLFAEPHSELLDQHAPCPICDPSAGITPSRLDTAIHSACHNTSHRADDLEFTVAARGWSQCISFGSFEVYRRRFEETRSFFESKFEEASKLGSEMLKAVIESAEND